MHQLEKLASPSVEESFAITIIGIDKETKITSYAIVYVVVTGANKGIGFEIVEELVSNGVKVVLTAKMRRGGLQPVEKLKGVVFL
ncbi:Short-chain dehydrogenase/reductase SDR [Sesbania bispinosa]|nr:Short-chain dehydrogenase/reductase SDR [Sesbania bispinosa]